MDAARSSLYIAVLLIQVASLSAIGPSVLSSSYTRKGLDLFDVSSDVAVMTFDFDQDIYYELTCPQRVQDPVVEPTIILPCCNATLTSNCTSPLSSASCLDATTDLDLEWLFPQQTSNLLRYVFKVANPSTCHSVMLGTRMTFGYISSKLFLVYDNFKENTNEDFTSAYFSSTGLFVCCSSIRARKSDWDGTLYVNLEVVVSSKWQLQMLGSPRVSATDYFHTNRIEVHCANGYNFTRCQSLLTGECYPLPPTADDPASNFLVFASGRVPDTKIIPKRLAISLVFRSTSFSSGSSATTAFMADTLILDPNNQCTIKFPNLVNSAGEAAVIAPLPQERRINCSQSEFSSIVQEFMTEVDQFSNSYINATMPEQAIERFIYALSLTWREGWTSCVSFIEDQLLRTETDSETFTNSVYCPFTNPTDPQYLTDPCCNSRQQEFQCCRARNITVDKFENAAVNADAIARQCRSSQCITETINDYLALQQSSTNRLSGCTARSSNALVSKGTIRAVLESCSGSLVERFCLTDSECQEYTSRDDSRCSSSGTCEIPCTSNNDCLTNYCDSATNTCKMLNLFDVQNFPYDRIGPQYVRCMANTVDGILFSYFKRGFGVSPDGTFEDVSNAMLEAVGSQQCVGFGGSLFSALGIVSNFSTQEQCELSKSCNWAPCDSITNPHCNATTCEDSNLSEYFCGFCIYDQCFEVSTFPVCKYQALPTEQNCTDFGGSYNPFVSGSKCIRPNSSDGCFPASNCPSSATPCAAYCYVPSLSTTAQDCEGTTVGGQTTQFKTWTRDGLTYNSCQLPSITTLDACIDLQPGQTSWWPGTMASSPLFNTEGSCKSFGTCNLDLNNLSASSLSDVASSVTFAGGCYGYCTTCSTCSKQDDCEVSGYCSDKRGCYAPYREDRSISVPCPAGMEWTPKGCLIDPVYVSSEADCLSPNVWHDVSPNRTACNELIMCRENATISAFSLTARDPSMRLRSWSFKDDEECAKCGGERRPYFTWTPNGEWISAKFRPFEWRKREMVTVNKWITLFDVSQLTTEITTVVARRYVDVLSSELLCRFGQTQSAAGQIVCYCSGEDSESDCSPFSDVRDAPIGIVPVCSQVDEITSFDDRQISIEPQDVQVTGSVCAPVRVGIVPISQFNSRQTITLSSVSLSSSRDLDSGQERFYVNENKIVVGEVLGDGLSTNYSGYSIQGMRACIPLPDVSTARLAGITKFTIFSIPLGTRDLNITVSDIFDATLESHCFKLETDGRAYFTLALVDDWQSLQFISTLTSGEQALVAVGITLYLIALIASVYHFAISLARRDHNKPLLTQSRIALGLLIIFLIIRVLYLILFITGTFKKAQSADVIFSELPALVFLNIYCIIVLRWAALYHFGLRDAKESFRKLKPVLYAFDGVLGAAFIILLIVYFSLSDQITITCESDLDADSIATTPKQIVAIVYKAFFALVCIMLSIAFLVYGSRIVQSSRSFTVVSLDRTERRAIQKRKKDIIMKIVITVVCTVCLLGQAANLLRASATNEPGLLILVFVYPIELLPSMMFIVILKKVPFFYRPGLFGKRAIDGKRATTRNPAYGTYSSGTSIDDSEHGVPLSETFNEESTISFSEIKVAQEIGTGNYGKINLGTWNGAQCALKRSKAFERAEFVREAKLVMNLPPHENVVRTFGLTNDSFNLMLVMEYCNGGSVDVKLFDLPEPVSDKEKLRTLIGIAQGMLHLHQNKIIHRDLAARNILINNGVHKVSDFGLSRKVDDVLRNSTTRNNVGPIRWMAPEALRDSAYSAKTDVWSFGIVMYEVIAQSEPHVDEDPLFIGIKIRDGAVFPRLPQTSDSVLKTLMEQCCQKEPNARPDFEEICNVLLLRWQELYENS